MQAEDRITARINKYSKMGDFEVVDLTEKKTGERRSKIKFGYTLPSFGSNKD